MQWYLTSWIWRQSIISQLASLYLCIFYQANIDCDIAGYKQKCCFGSCETTFKDRFGNHKKLFNHVKHGNNTKLLKEFWEIKKRNGKPKTTWKIIKICRSYNPNSKRCLLCLNEKYEMATYKGDNLLKKRTEIINTCKHRSKYKLANCGTIDWRQIHAIRYHYNASF